MFLVLGTVAMSSVADKNEKGFRYAVREIDAYSSRF